MLENVKVAQIKKFKKQSPFIFEFCFWEDPPHPVNWSPNALCVFFFGEVSIGKFAKKSSSPFIFTFTF